MANYELFTKNKPECSDLWLEMNRPFSGNNIIRHYKTNSSYLTARMYAIMPSPLAEVSYS